VQEVSLGCADDKAFALLRLAPSSDKHLISPYSSMTISTWSNTRVLRIREMITEDQVSWSFIEYIYGEQFKENMHVHIGV